MTTIDIATDPVGIAISPEIGSRWFHEFVCKFRELEDRGYVGVSLRELAVAAREYVVDPEKRKLLLSVEVWFPNDPVCNDPGDSLWVDGEPPESLIEKEAKTGYTFDRAFKLGTAEQCMRVIALLQRAVRTWGDTAK